MASKMKRLGLIAAVLSAAACEQTIDRTAEVPAPTLSLVQASGGALDLQIAGAFALRGLQGAIVYDAKTVKVTKIEAGQDAERLDRVFWSDVAKATGRITVGMSDTRRVMLPARGTLLRIHVQRAGAAGSTTVSFDNPLGAIDGGERVELSPTRLEVTLP